MNNKKNIIISIIIPTLLIVNFTKADVLFSHGDESIFHDKANNKYIIKYTANDGRLIEIPWTPTSDVYVQISTSFSALDNGMISYKYQVDVDKSSNNSLSGFRIDTPIEGPNIETPSNWDVIIRKSYKPNSSNTVIGWYTATSPVPPGANVKGFRVVGFALPVYGTTYVQADTEILSFPDHGPSYETTMYFQNNIVDKYFDGMIINTAIPLIPISEPFNPVVTYGVFHSFIQEYIQKQYIDRNISDDISNASTKVLRSLDKPSKDTLLNLNALKILISANDLNNKSDGKTALNNELREILKFNIEYFIRKLQGDYE